MTNHATALRGPAPRLPDEDPLAAEFGSLDTLLSSLQAPRAPPGQSPELHDSPIRFTTLQLCS